MNPKKNDNNESPGLLHRLRRDIDCMDERILELMIKRLHIAREIHRNKVVMQLPVTDTHRIEHILENISEKASCHGLNREIIRDIWAKIIELSIDYQTRAAAD